LDQTSVKNNENCLFLGIEENKKANVKELVKLVSDIHCINKDGDTALHAPSKS
jgi:ankyrin repeat protein